MNTTNINMARKTPISRPRMLTIWAANNGRLLLDPQRGLVGVGDVAEVVHGRR